MADADRVHAYIVPADLRHRNFFEIVSAYTRAFQVV